MAKTIDADVKSRAKAKAARRARSTKKDLIKRAVRVMGFVAKEKAKARGELARVLHEFEGKLLRVAGRVVRKVTGKGGNTRKVK